MLVLSLISMASAADVCAGVKFKADPFGGGSTATEVVQALSKFTAASVVLDLKGGVTEITITTKEFGAINGSVPAGTEIPFAFDDGTVLKFGTVRETPRQSYVTDSQVMTLSPYSMQLDVAALNAFAASPVAAVRVPTAAGPYDWKPNGGLKKKLMAAAACFATKAAAAPLAAPAPAGPTN